MGRLDGRVAVVTGASRGLGKAIAKALAAEGAAVAVVARTEQVWDDRLPGTIGETVGEIADAGGRAVAVRADLLVREDRARLVDEARAALGPITLLVNNAAFTAPGRPPTAGGAVSRASPRASEQGGAVSRASPRASEQGGAVSRASPRASETKRARREPTGRRSSRRRSARTSGTSRSVRWRRTS